MTLFFNYKILFTLSIFMFFCTGCESKEYVRHLASEAGMIIPHHTSKQEILAYLGQPEKKQSLSNDSEVWIYYQQNKSFLRKAPYVGEKLGSEDYDVIVLVFNGEIVNTCQYRMFAEAEFRESHIVTGKKSDAD